MRVRNSIRAALYVCVAILVCAAPAPESAQAAGAGTAPITVPFDHLATGFELDGVHRDLPCESCHLNAVFKGTPRDCGTCHTTGSVFNATPKVSWHIRSSNNCAACHDTNSFRPGVHFNHAEVMGACVSCHNGTNAQGEGPSHPATSQNCAACHTVLSWNPPANVDHTQIPLAVAGFCIICHNGVQASGKPANHIATNLECGDCHLTTSWLGATFDHTGIVNNCVSCHNGTKAVGKQGGHMPTSTTCENCHTTGIGTATPSWVPSKFDHTQAATPNTCLPCHGGSFKISTGFVEGQPPNHVPLNASTQDCVLCHGSNPAAETWTVLAASIPTLHTGLNVANCVLCHGGETFAGVPAPYVPMNISGVSPTKATPLVPPHIPVLAGTDCSACHGAAYQAGGFGPATAMSAAKHAFVTTSCDTCHDTGKAYYVGGGTPLQLRPQNHVTSADTRMATGDCSACHETTDWVSTALPAGHMPNPANLGCVQCHAGAPADYGAATLAPNAALHTGISGNCGLCHGNNVTALTWFNAFTPKDAILTPSHIPYLAGTDCSSCHTPGNYATGGFGPMNMTAATHAFVPPSCNTCHEAGLTFTLGAANPPLQGRPADHTIGLMVAPNDCSLCHTTTNWNSGTLPPGHMPNPANQNCATCHTAAPTDFTAATLASIPVLHTGISSGCNQCHGGTAAPLTWYLNYAPKAAVLGPPAHIPYLAGTDCGACHAANYVTGGFGPTNMSAAKHAFVPTTCDNCHEAGLNFYLGASTPPLQGRPADHLSSSNPQQVTGDCSGCHETSDWIATALPVGHMPNPGGQTCAVCHPAAPTSYKAPFASTAVLHTGITSGCAQCHGATQLSFYNNDLVIKSGVLSPPHIPAFTGTDCSACHAPNFVAGGFGPMNMTQATHAGVGSTCNGCHEAGLSFYMGSANPGLQGRPADHTSGKMVAPNDCSICHNTANWNSTALPAGHMPNPANQACSVCHTASPTDYTRATLAANSVLHTGISGGCGQCHGGTTALTWYNNFTPKDAVLAPAHIPYLAGTDCGACHASSTYAAGTFGPMNMTQATHSFVATNCVTCHEKGVSLYMGAANPALQGRPADHTTGQMVAPNDCSVCHTTANWNSTALPAGHMPNPGNQGCSVCHTTAPADYSTTTLAANAKLHTGITSGCITCHGAPNATPPVFYNNYTPKSAVLSPVHIPTKTTACEACHSNTVFTSFSGASMTAAEHTTMFAVIGSTCDACHNKVTPALNFYGVSNLQVRPGDHNSGNKLNEDCSACHSPKKWNNSQVRAVAATNVRNMVVTMVATPGSSAAASAGGGAMTVTRGAAGTSGGTGARNGGIVSPGTARAMSIGTPAAGAAAGAAMSHFGVTVNCVSCHNGVLASGKGPAHIAADNRCENCHTTTAWMPARFDHQGVSASCAGCHNGVTAQGRPTTHLQTVKDCSACHGSIAWRPAVFNHVGASANCQSCHNGAAAAGKPINHPVAGSDCGACHNTAGWTVLAPPAKLNPLIHLPRGSGGGTAPPRAAGAARK